MTTRSPTLTGSRKSTRSIETVTTCCRQCLKAAIAAALSINDRITPPKTFPRLLASWGIISSEVSCWDSLTVLAGRVIRGVGEAEGAGHGAREGADART